MTFVPLSQGRFALVDDEDADLTALRWHAGKHDKAFYAAQKVRAADGTWTTRYLHRVIAARVGITGEVDHKNRNGLDCTRGNLRPATRSQNAANRGVQSNNTSGIKGVYWFPRHRKWRAQVDVNNKRRYLGYFADKEEAASVVKAARERLHGEFACHEDTAQ